MSYHRYRTINFRPETRARIAQAEEILEDYPGQRLTARQVYYQFVSRDLLANTPSNYKLLTGWLSDARYAGLIDWDAIEDRGREPDSPAEWDTIQDRVESALRTFRLPRWKTQKCHVELWVEKQALAGVLAPLAREFHVTLMVNKGYSSSSAMKESADRMREAAGLDTEECRERMRALDDAAEFARGNYEGDDDGWKSDDKYVEVHDAFVDWKNENTKATRLFYLGDHDPSGEDMVRDIADRLREFGVYRLTVEKLALTMAQIKKFRPPPNPAKLTDSRAKAYIEKYGDKSWELDALPPDELIRIIRGAFRSVIDVGAMDKVKAEEEQLKERLRKMVVRL